MTERRGGLDRRRHNDETCPVHQQVDYSRLVPLLTKGIQELTESVQSLQSTIKELEDRITDLEDHYE